MKYKVDSDQSRTTVLNILAKLPLESPWQVSVDPWVDSRTLEQNSRLHAMFRDIGNHFGYSTSEIKTVIKEELGMYHDIQGKHKTVRIYDETSKMKKQELTDLIEQVFMWAASHGVLLE